MGRDRPQELPSGLRPLMVNLALTTAAVLASLICVELFLRFVPGLGDPLLYRSSPLFGYRLQENQHVSRRGVEIMVNNLGLRADADWDASRTGKILFLGNSVTFGGTYLSNADLFSHLAVTDIPDAIAGNGGVNGWGVENIHALVVRSGFLPASVYVTVLQDMDFDRGLSKFAGQPFWSRKPIFAVEELLVLAGFHLLQHAKEGHEQGVHPAERERAVEEAVRRLKEMDDFLKCQGFVHLIYISTDARQLLDGVPRDSVVAKHLRLNGTEVHYLADRPEIHDLSAEEVDRLFYDWNHLDKEGHKLWGRIIGEDLKRVAGKSAD